MLRVDSAQVVLDLTRVALQFPFLTAGVVLSQLACTWLFLELAMAHPWLLIAAAACMCFTLEAALSVATGGLLAGMPEIVYRALLERTFFEVFREVLVKLVYAVTAIMQLLILAVADLDEQRTKEILEEMDPAFRRRAFQQPMLMMLPVSLRLLVLGPFHDAIHGASLDVTGCKAEMDCHEGKKWKESVDPLCGETEPSMSLEDLVSLVRHPGHVTPSISKPLQQAFTGVVTDSAMSAIKMGGMHQVVVTKDHVHSLVTSAQEKVATTSVAVAKGTISGGARGGGAGLLSGGVIGAACGLIPSVFTFGLSIPIGAVVGGGTGLVVGSSVGATAGAVGSMVAGKDAPAATKDRELPEDEVS